AQIARHGLTHPDPEGERTEYNDRIDPRGQMSHADVRRDRDQRSERAGREAGKPAAKAECQAMAPVAEHSRVDGRVEHRRRARRALRALSLRRRGAETPGWPGEERLESLEEAGQVGFRKLSHDADLEIVRRQRRLGPVD